MKNPYLCSVIRKCGHGTEISLRREKICLSADKQLEVLRSDRNHSRQIANHSKNMTTYDANS